MKILQIRLYMLCNTITDWVNAKWPLPYLEGSDIACLHKIFTTEKEHTTHHHVDDSILIYMQIYDIGIFKIYYDSGSST